MHFSLLHVVLPDELTRELHSNVRHELRSSVNRSHIGQLPWENQRITIGVPGL